MSLLVLVLSGSAALASCITQQTGRGSSSPAASTAVLTDTERRFRCTCRQRLGADGCALTADLVLIGNEARVQVSGHPEKSSVRGFRYGPVIRYTGFGSYLDGVAYAVDMEVTPQLAEQGAAGVMHFLDAEESVITPAAVFDCTPAAGE